jgi:hypothetical protein
MLKNISIYHGRYLKVWRNHGDTVILLKVYFVINTG